MNPKVGSLERLSSTDRQTFLEFGRGAVVPVPFSRVHDAFQHYAALYPSNVAVEDFEETITYAELDRQSNFLALHLQSLGVAPGARVCLLAERSIYMVVGILAILKAGGGYVPLDGNIASDKTLDHVLADSKAAAALVMRAFKQRIRANVPTVCLEDVLSEVDLHSDVQRPQAKVSTNDSVYIIYTSGTTGVPKGVDVKHGNVTNLVCLSPGNLTLAPGRRISQLMNIAFDMAQWEILGSLSNGATLCLRGKSSKQWKAVMKRVQVIVATPSMLVPHVAAEHPNVEVVAVAGEPCPVSLADSWGANAKFYNSCGPTEITIVNTMQLHTPASPLSIGGPTPNNNVYVLDEDMNPVPIGEQGVMWAGGAGITRGYLNLPEKTKERYKRDPYANDGSMMFNTGDLGRWMPHGGLEVLGRTDDQVKVKGFRVELDGVAAAMETTPGVKVAVALLVEGELWGFVTPGTIEQASVTSAASKIQPYYAVPTRILAMDEFPKTANGKNDKRALRQMAIDQVEKEKVVATVLSVEAEKVKPDPELALPTSVSHAISSFLSSPNVLGRSIQVTLPNHPQPVHIHISAGVATPVVTQDIVLPTLSGLGPASLAPSGSATPSGSVEALDEKVLESGATSVSASEKGLEWEGYEDDELPKKTQGHYLRNLRHQVFSLYRRLFGIVFVINMAIFIAVCVQETSVPKIGEIVVANLSAAILMRQDYVVNAFFKVFTLVPRSWPLAIRRVAARVYHIGGLHSGFAVSGTVWLVLFTAKATKDLLDGGKTSIATLVITWVIMFFLFGIVAFAMPGMRTKRHDSFERVHRFAGWTAAAMVWAQQASARLFATNTFLSLLSQNMSGDAWLAALQDVDSVVYKPEDWAGKKWPDDPPPDLFYARENLLIIPSNTFSPAFPIDSNLSPRHFVNSVLPTRSSDLISGNADFWFSRDEPTTDVARLLTRSVPPDFIVNSLLKSLGQRMIDGFKSVVDPRFCDGQERFPIYVLQFWVEVRENVAYQDHWRDAISFVEKRRALTQDEGTKKALEEAWKMLDRIGWKERIPEYRLNTMSLMGFLGSGWLSDEQIDMMIGHIALRLKREASKMGKRVAIASLAFSNKIMNPSIQKSYDKPIEELDRVMRHFELVIKEDDIEVLYMPAHINNNHWIAVEVDFVRGQVSFGDSLTDKTTPTSRHLFQKINLWLRKRFNRCFVKGAQLPCGRQSDTFSCGVCFANTVVHNVFGDPLFDPVHALRYRIEWFLALCRDCPSVRHIENNQDISVDDHVRDLEASQTHPIRRLCLADLLNPAASVPDGDSSPVEVDLVSSDSESESQFPPSTAGTDLESAFSIHDDASTPDIHGDLAGDEDMESLFAPSEGSETSATSLPSSTSSKVVSVAKSIGNRLRKACSPNTLEKRISKSPSPLRDAFSTLRKGAAKGKRERSAVIETESSDGSSDTESAEPTTTKRRLGSSRSATHSRKVRAAQKAGTFQIDQKRLANWKAELKQMDSNIQFKDDGVSYQHSACMRWRKAKQAYDLTRVRAHIDSCKIKPAKPVKGVVGSKRVTDFFTRKAGSGDSPQASAGGVKVAKDLKNEQSRPIKAKEAPRMTVCPGLTADYDAAIESYLRRTGVSGGGGESITKIAKARFKKAFRSLNKKHQADVLAAQERSHTWQNKHDLDPPRVYARSCTREVLDLSPHDPLPCVECLNVYKGRLFKNAIRRQTPKDNHYVHVNKRFRPKALGEIYARARGVKELLEEKAEKSPFIRYALGVLKGTYKNDVFEGLAQAMVTKYDKEARGVGLRNFKYTPAYDEFLHILRIHSPAAYRAFGQSLPARTPRSYRQKEAREPRFPMEICDRTYELATSHMQSLNYTGPVGLSCDDTKLFGALRLYWDSEKETHYLIGAVGGPIEVADPDAVREVINDAKHVKASKIRVWCLTFQVPGAIPVVLHAMPIGTGFDAPKLEVYSRTLIRGLISRGVKVISYACDGTEVERSVQKLLIKHSDSQIKYKIPSPKAGGRDIDVIIPVFDGQPVAMVQDSKHALKTFRNNLFSGARLLVLANHTAYHAQVHKVASEKNSPIYVKDADDPDKQDDNAAVRLPSAATLQYLSENHPEWPGLMVYLFVFGELIDAYQNRHLDHCERLLMTLRARYFLDLWGGSLDVAGTNKTLHFLSRECLDITRIVIEGYIGLLIIHRDYLPEQVPFLPWLHSSEACEHTFGICRQIVKDFCYADFLYMMPKLCVSLRQAVLKARVNNAQDTQSGYNHTYFDCTDLKISALAAFPTQKQFKEISQAAFNEADSLFVVLGVDPGVIRRLQALRDQGIPRIGSINTWFSSVEDDGDSDSDDDMDEDSICEAQELQDLMDRAEQDDVQSASTRVQEDKLSSLSYAAASLFVDDHVAVQAFADIDEDDTALDEECLDIAMYQKKVSEIMTSNPAASLPPITISPSIFGKQGVALSNPVSFDYSALISLREKHQTRQAEKGVRGYGKQNNSSKNTNNNEPGTRAKLIKAMSDVLKDIGEHGLTTGAGRSARTKAMNSNNDSTPSSGNSANAAAAAATAARAAAKKRRDVFTAALGSGHLLNVILDARVSAINPLKAGDWVLMEANPGGQRKIYLAQVETLYAKTGGKNGRHATVLESKSNIAAFSNIAARLFEFSDIHGLFTSIPEATALLQTRSFAILPQIHVLTVVKAPTIVTTDQAPETAMLTSADFALYNELQASSDEIFSAIDSFKSRKRT